jgi:rSAM/selenodomain-associated transferase 2
MAVSVILPTLNEAGSIAELIAELRAQGAGEIIVVDGGSSDGTPGAAGAADRVLRAPRGRAAQMNAGAAQARGDVLLFLHADCRLEPGALAAAEKILSRRDVLAGCYTMSVPAEGMLYRGIEAAATARVRTTGLIYGDQGLFLRRADFERLKGFPEVRFMEDVWFSRVLRRHGRIAVAPQRIFVSPRRWQRVGLVRQTLRNWTLTALAGLGIHPDRLAAYYPAIR